MIYDTRRLLIVSTTIWVFYHATSLCINVTNHSGNLCMLTFRLANGDPLRHMPWPRRPKPYTGFSIPVGKSLQTMWAMIKLSKVLLHFFSAPRWSHCIRPYDLRCWIALTGGTTFYYLYLVLRNVIGVGCHSLNHLALVLNSSPENSRRNSCLYSRPSTNSHLSTMATSPQRLLFSVLAGCAYIHSCIKSSTAVTSLQWQRPLGGVSNCQKNLSPTASISSDWRKSKKGNETWSVWRVDAQTLQVVQLYMRTLFKLVQ